MLHGLTMYQVFQVTCFLEEKATLSSGFIYWTPVEDKLGIKESFLPPLQCQLTLAAGHKHLG